MLADSSADAGRDAARALERMAADPLLGEAFRSAVRANVVGREPGSREALAKVARGAADAAFVHATDALRAASPISVTALPPEYAVEAVYMACVASGQRRMRPPWHSPRFSPATGRAASCAGMASASEALTGLPM